MKNTYEKLQYCQKMLKVGKNRYNKFANFKYRSLEDIFEGLKPILGEIDAYITVTDELVLIGDRYYVKATATFADGDVRIMTTGYAREPLNKKGMDESQITGTASSYARKIAMNGLFALDDAKDADDNKNGESKPKEKQNEIVDMAFLAYEAKHQAILTEEAFLHFEFDRKLFEKAIIKEFKKLPTNQASVPKIIKAIKPEEILKEKTDADV